jgi:uncharacterized protein
MSFNASMLKRINGYTSPDTETRKSSIDGFGLFAQKKLNGGVVVAAWGGRIMRGKELGKLPKAIGRNYAIELYPDFYIAETKKSELDASDFINHSCEPNCEIVNLLIMRTKRSIKKGEELTADFSNSRGTKVPCACGTKACKGWVRF